jgi:hypothetical protein
MRSTELPVKCSIWQYCPRVRRTIFNLSWGIKSSRPGRKAGAIAENVPRRDFWISPHHAMYLDGVLIEARHLVNGVSVVRAGRVEKVEYVHIELGTHDVIIAEGALPELPVMRQGTDSVEHGLYWPPPCQPPT